MIDEDGGHAFALPTLRLGLKEAYFIAPKRLSNELDEMIGADPAT
jgi:hypothetical protein